MDFIVGKAVPKREDRIGATETFGGKLSELVCGRGNGCLANRSRLFCQTCNCQMGLALSMINTIPDIVIIKHGSVGCGNSSQVDKNFINGLKARGLSVKPLVWVSTNLDETDVITGGEEKLRKAIAKLDALHRPAAIVVLTTCSTGIIGDDVDSVVEEMRGKVSTPIILVHCEGFKTKISATAYDAVYHGLLGGLAFTDEDEEEPICERDIYRLNRDYKKQRTLNVFNAFSIGRNDELELQRLLNALELNVNFYPNFSHPESFKYISEASLNVGLCPTHDDYFLKYLEARFGIPYLINNMPVGIKNTRDWLLEIAERFDAKDAANRILEMETRVLEDALEPLREKLTGKRVFVTGGEIRVVVTAMLLEELGCKLVGLRGHHYDEFGDGIYAKLLENHADMDVNIATTQTFELANLIRRAAPDLILAHNGSHITAAKLGVPSLPVYSQGNFYMGFMGAFEVARRAAKVLENTAYVKKLSENTRLPYHPAWFEKDPFTYIKANEL